MAPLQSIKPTADVRTAWSVGVAKAGDYTFTPAVVGDVVYAASAKGTLSRIEDGKTSGRSMLARLCRPVSVPTASWSSLVRQRAMSGLLGRRWQGIVEGPGIERSAGCPGCG
jgi:hypothetical protein